MYGEGKEVMRTVVKIGALLALIVLVGALGFYLGFRNGADTMSTLASQNQVSGALSRINASLTAIGKNDLQYSLGQHRRDMGAALFDLGTYAPAVPYWKCKERDQNIVRDARNYLSSHPDVNGLPPKELLDQALKFCQ
jgi:hypothetical protein